MNPLTQEDALTLVAFIIQKTKTEGDNTAAENFKKAVSTFDFNKPVTTEQAVDSSFDLLGDVARISPGVGDDKAVEYAEIAYKTFNGTSYIRNAIQALRDRRRAKRG